MVVTTPSIKLLQPKLTCSTRAQTRCQSALLVKPVGYAHHGRNVGQTEATTRYTAERNVLGFYTVGDGGAQNKSGPGYDST